MHSVIGSCSLCGGDVVLPGEWGGLEPPTPTCRSCGARKAQPGRPEIPMEHPYKKAPDARGFWDNGARRWVSDTSEG